MGMVEGGEIGYVALNWTLKKPENLGLHHLMTGWLPQKPGMLLKKVLKVVACSLTTYYPGVKCVTYAE
jgi:hypothetical protein